MWGVGSTVCPIPGLDPGHMVIYHSWSLLLEHLLFCDQKTARLSDQSTNNCKIQERSTLHIGNCLLLKSSIRLRLTHTHTHTHTHSLSRLGNLSELTMPIRQTLNKRQPKKCQFHTHIHTIHTYRQLGLTRIVFGGGRRCRLHTSGHKTESKDWAIALPITVLLHPLLLGPILLHTLFFLVHELVNKHVCLYELTLLTLTAQLLDHILLL